MFHKIFNIFIFQLQYIVSSALFNFFLKLRSILVENPAWYKLKINQNFFYFKKIAVSPRIRMLFLHKSAKNLYGTYIFIFYNDRPFRAFLYIQGNPKYYHYYLQPLVFLLIKSMLINEFKPVIFNPEIPKDSIKYIFRYSTKCLKLSCYWCPYSVYIRESKRIS